MRRRESAAVVERYAFDEREGTGKQEQDSDELRKGNGYAAGYITSYRRNETKMRAGVVFESPAKD